MTPFSTKQLARTLVFIALLMSGVVSCKKDEASVTNTPAPEKPGAIGKMSLAATEVLLHPSTPSLLLAPGENTAITVSQLTATPGDTTPQGLVYTSSNPQIAAVSSAGAVEAKADGSAVITATDAKSHKVSIVVDVQAASYLPKAADAVSVSFDSPLITLNKEKSEILQPTILNRLGQKLKLPYTLIFHSGGVDKELTEARNIAANYPADGTYTVSCKVGQTTLRGQGNVIVVSPTNSLLAGRKAGIISVNLGWGRFPVYFNANGLESLPVRGLVYRLTPKVVNGKTDLEFSSHEEDLAVATENGTVLTASGTKLTSVKAGIGRWRVVADNFIGPWESSQVFYDFSGGWICKNNKQGYSIQLLVPDITKKVVHEGVQGNQSEMYTVYELWAGWFRQRAKAQAQFTDLSSKVSRAVSNAYIGPLSNCTICAFPTELQKVGISYGELETRYDNLRGVIAYLNDNEFTLFDGTQNGPIFTRGPVSFVAQPTPTVVKTLAPVLSLPLDAELKAIVTGTPELKNRGFLLSQKPNPMLGASSSDVYTLSDSGSDSEFSYFVSLPEQTKQYYVKAFAQAKTGAVTYGDQVSFTTGTLCDVTQRPIRDAKNEYSTTKDATTPEFRNFEMTSGYNFRPDGCQYSIYTSDLSGTAQGFSCSFAFGEKPQGGKKYKVVRGGYYLSKLAADEVSLSLRYWYSTESGANDETIEVIGSTTGDSFTITGKNIKMSDYSGVVYYSSFKIRSL
ncbi:Ig-like domain-containing protein [Hymenobacter elongatus]|uniref:BIG2 domain-containing protein n=1 Tax=Hymenobacter elongatus TaxID=877208 RepID=A0A4Z0PR80_9BACT|nr:Ig-like domain-containing protein [Hymenobacter elongatus]TGE17817.1 hypothetical protein E5J99_06405 [Hymenobacter elongatus]